MKSIRSLFIAFVLMTQAAVAELRLPTVISDHAMLQADKPVAIWGWAEPGAQVKVAFAGDAAGASCDFSATADAAGKWSGQLAKQKSGTAGRLEVTTDKGGAKTVSDVLFGEVWLGGGQSNMVYTIDGKAGGDWENPEEVAAIQQNIATAQKEADAAQPPIRYFLVGGGGADEPRDDIGGKWVLGDSKNVGTFSAVAWKFAVALQNKAHVPVGLIVSCFGGTPVQAWMSKETLASTPAGVEVMDRTQKAIAEGQLAQPKYDADLKAWMDANTTKELQAQNIKTRPRAPFSSKGYVMPVRLYNGMIHGLQPYTLRGIIWFQADGNNGWPFEYSELFQALIKEWRAEWKEELPFYFVEMNNMGVPQANPIQGGALPFIREQQHGALRLPGVGMVAAIDVGTTNAYFPKKKPVDERLAGLALRDCYGQARAGREPHFQKLRHRGQQGPAEI